MNPFVQPSLFRNKKYIRLITLGIISYINHFSTLFLLPQVLIHLFKLMPGQAGLIIFPGALVAMLASNRIGKIIDRYGNSMLLRLTPWLLLTAAVSFALFADRSIYAVMVVYMLMSVGFSALNSSVSNELSRVLPGEHVGSGMGLFQLLQFISGAFSVAISGIVLSEKARFRSADHSRLFSGAWASSPHWLLPFLGCTMHLPGRRRLEMTSSYCRKKVLDWPNYKNSGSRGLENKS